MGSCFSSKAAMAALLALAWTACTDHDVPSGATQHRAEIVAAQSGVFRDTPSGLVTSGAGWSARVTPGGAVELGAAGAVLELETVALGRDTSMPLVAARVTAASEGVVVEREHATEVVSRIEHGVEQQWRFLQRPAGTSALEVVVSVAGAELVGHDASGLHFADLRRGVRFRYGLATWIDGNGKRTAVSTSTHDGTITMTVPAALLASSPFPAVLDPTVEVEVELDPASAYLPARLAQHAASASSDGVDALVVWADQRDNPFEIFGAGVDASGAAYQRANVRLTDAGMFDGQTAYLQTDANGDRQFVLVASNMFEVLATPITMSATGELTAAPARALFTPQPGVFSGVMSVASSPANGHYLVLFHAGNAGGTNAYTQIFDFAHDPLTAPQPLYDADFPQGFESRATFASSSYLVASRRGPSAALSVRVVSPTTALETSIFTVSAEGNGPDRQSIAFNGTSALVAWMDRRVDGQEHIWVRRVGEAGTTSAEIEIAGLPGSQFAPHVIAGDAAQDDFFVVWLDERTVESELVGASLSSTNTITRFESGNVVSRPGGTRVGNAPLIVFDDGGGGTLPETTDVWTRDFTTNWLAPRRLSEQANEQTSAAVAQGLVAWTDNRNGHDNSDVFAIVIDDTGAPTSAVITVSTDPDFEDDSDVARGNGESVVVWRRGDDTPSGGATTEIVAALVDASGAVVDTAIVASGTVNLYPRIIADGSGYLVTWQTGAFSCEAFCQFFPAEPRLATLTTSGGTISVGAPSTAGEVGLGPALARSAGGAILWVWEHAGDIHGARVTAGSPGPAWPIIAAPGRQSRPALAMDDSVALIAFEDDRDGGSQIFAATLAADDTVSVLGAISADVFAREPEVVDADDGYSFVVVWDGSAFGAPEQVWGAWVKKTGALADPTPRQLTHNTLGASRRPHIAPLGPGRMVIGFDAVGAERAERARTAVIDSGQIDGTICDVPDQCASRFCADGICCSEPCTGDCRQCGDGGVCALVTDREDDSCFGDEECNAEGVCLRADGETCNEDSAVCASGFCVDGVCCEEACSGVCDKCAGETAGQCRPNACGNFSCHDDKTCRETCTESRHCLDTFQCVNGECVTPPDMGAADAGCTCLVAGGHHDDHGWLLLTLAAVALLRRKGAHSRIRACAVHETV